MLIMTSKSNVCKSIVCIHLFVNMTMKKIILKLCHYNFLIKIFIYKLILLINNIHVYNIIYNYIYI